MKEKKENAIVNNQYQTSSTDLFSFGCDIPETDGRGSATLRKNQWMAGKRQFGSI